MSVCVVGNAPGMRGTNLGPIIDSCDHVVRVNNFVIEGHEADVGTKTTVWCQTMFGVREDPPPIGVQQVWVVSLPQWVMANELVRDNYLRRSQMYEAPVFLIPYSVERDLSKVVPTFSKVAGGRGPSTGLQALFMAGLMFGFPVHYCGIGQMHLENRYYWGSSGKRSNKHSGEAERLVLRELESRDMIRSIRNLSVEP